MTEADLPMPLPLLLGIVGLAGGVLTAIIAAVSKKWRTPADDREDRKIGIEADERLLARFEKLLDSPERTGPSWTGATPWCESCETWAASTSCPLPPRTS